MSIKDLLRPYRDDMLKKQRNYLELQDLNAGDRAIALAFELYRLSNDTYIMAREDYKKGELK
jgi:hypothetical protein